MKKIWVIITIAAALGVILMGAGYALGGSFSYMSQLLKEKNMVTFVTDSDFLRKNTEAISEIQIDVLSANIEIIPADYYGYELLFGRNSGIEYQFENGLLSVEQEIRWFPFHWLMFLGPQTGTVRVYMPQNAELSSVTLETLSGNINVQGILASELNVSAKSGHIDLRQIQARHMDIDVTSGNSILTSCSAESLEVDAASGRFTAENLSVSKSFDADIISGHLLISGDLRGNTDIKIISGTVTLNLAGKLTEYNKSLSAVSGSIRVNGGKTGAYAEMFGVPNSLNVHTTSGSISINFQDQ